MASASTELLERRDVRQGAVGECWRAAASETRSANARHLPLKLNMVLSGGGSAQTVVNEWARAEVGGTGLLDVDGCPSSRLCMVVCTNTHSQYARRQLSLAACAAADLRPRAWSLRRARCGPRQRAPQSQPASYVECVPPLGAFCLSCCSPPADSQLATFGCAAAPSGPMLQSGRGLQVPALSRAWRTFISPPRATASRYCLALLPRHLSPHLCSHHGPRLTSA